MTTKVLLFSGGLDSYITSKIWMPDILLYCALGHKYQNAEIKNIEKTGLNVVIDTRLFLGDKEMDNAIIPLRNLMMINIASYYGESIGLGVLRDEINPDKSLQFREQATAILNTCYAKSYWSDGTEYKVVYPIIQYDKAQLIEYFINHVGTKQELINNTRSCYQQTKKHCGHCSACIKRYVAMRLNNITEDYENDPHSSPYLNEMRRRLSSFSETRYKQVVSVFPELLY